MRTGDPKCKTALGFLTVIEHEEQGLFGGYLVLNLAGRPLEFHCTAPVKPNRAQQILYGPTLEPYLYGEQIGQTLVSKSTAEPLVICTDREAVLAVREFISAPVALVLPPDEEEAAAPATARAFRLDAPHAAFRPRAFQLGKNRLAVPASADGDRELISTRLAPCADTFDLAEPFSRIREAIDEARHGGQSR